MDVAAVRLFHSGPNRDMAETGRGVSSDRTQTLELIVKSVSLPWPSKTPRRRRHGVECCLILVIAGFAALSAVNAISTKHGTSPSERVAVGRQ